MKTWCCEYTWNCGSNKAALRNFKLLVDHYLSEGSELLSLNGAEQDI